MTKTQFLKNFENIKNVWMFFMKIDSCPFTVWEFENRINEIYKYGMFLNEEEFEKCIHINETQYKQLDDKDIKIKFPNSYSLPLWWKNIKGRQYATNGDVGRYSKIQTLDWIILSNKFFIIMPIDENLYMAVQTELIKIMS